MPNPKTGTVTFEVAQAVKEIKAGKVNYRVDKAGVVHAPVGRCSFDAGALVENAEALMVSVIRAKRRRRGAGTFEASPCPRPWARGQDRRGESRYVGALTVAVGEIASDRHLGGAGRQAGRRWPVV